MISSKKFKVFWLLLGDFALFYLSLCLALVLRYRNWETVKGLWPLHQAPFLFIHLLWLVIFYIAGLYDINIFASFKKLLDRLLKTMAIAGVLAIFIFYLTPGVEVTPKTNLFIDIVLLAGLLILWRRFFWILAGRTSKIKTLFFGASGEVKNLFERLKDNPHIGYEPAILLAEVDHNLLDLIKQHYIQLIVASREIMQNEKAAKQFYEALPLGIGIISFENFYESLVEKIPVYLINETWFLENLGEINKKTFGLIKRIIDVVFALILLIPTAIIFPIIWLLSKIESSDTILVRQKRAGRNGETFTLFKFRTMYNATEIDGKAKWAEEKDPRITKIGKLLRKTRLDELPQLVNILKGEMSFVGPRPERPEFVENLKKQIPHYAMRHLVKPGLSGWAQIKFPYGASVEDAMEKLQYDLYYIKNRSLILDLAIAAKTIATILQRQGR